MRDVETRRFRPNRLSFAVSLALASLVAGNVALAQDKPAAPDAAKAEEAVPTQVLVVGTRASQQSGIDRKKNAATAMDSIVAEDVGSLPDRNVGEAISRMAGIVLDRGDYGEGVSVSVRGNGADLTRVELDGQGVQSAGGTDLNGSGAGRGVELRQLSADLIKSVDVVKGSTADMTEGALGGGIIIKTRTGLDFKKPFASLRLGASQLSLNKKWTPDANLILSDKFLKGRLGLMMNVSTNTLSNEAHSMQVSQTAQQGYYRLADFDNSPEKTFSFNPSTVNTADIDATTPVRSTPLAGTAVFNSATPLEIITKSAAAQSKQACYDAFPALTAAELAAIPSSGNRGPAQATRGNELMTCLNQWADYTPSNVRYWIKKELDKKQNLDLRADFKVNNKLTVYAKGSFNRREATYQQLNYGLGNILMNQTTSLQPNYVGPTFLNGPGNLVRSVVPGSGYYLYNDPSAFSNAYPIAGTAINIDPASVVVDQSHHLTKYTISDGMAETDQIIDKAKVTGQYVQAGGTWKSGGLNVEFFIGDAKSDFKRAAQRFNYRQYYGQATMTLDPSGLWGYAFPATTNFNQADPLAYARLFTPTANANAQNLGAERINAVPAYTAAQQPLLTQVTGPGFQPSIRETGERTAKLDLTYSLPDSIPFFTRIKSGFNLRSSTSDAWVSNAGTKIIQSPVGKFGQPGFIPGIYLPSAQIRSNYVGCQDTPGSLGPGGNPCKYGYNPSNDAREALTTQLVLTPQQYQNIVSQTLVSPATDTSFFRGAKDRPNILIDNWMGIDVLKAVELAGFPNTNYDCVKKCTASDGKVYDQPVTKLEETIESFYLMSDFSFDRFPFTQRALPFGLELEGNMGYRYVRTKVHGTGSMTFISHKIIDGAFDIKNPSDPAGFVTNTIVQNTAVDAKTTDFLPIYNLAMWLVPEKLVVRYNRAKTVARPPVAQLLPANNCTYDERLIEVDADASHRCNGAIGNPALKARMNVNQNLSFEYYPNKDTMFTVTALEQKGKVGAFVTESVLGGHLFGGSDLIDPATGAKLSDLAFNYPTYVNGATSTRRGFELSTKTAFTFLPWLLRYTGMDANYTRVKSKYTTANVVDLITGEALPPPSESRTQYNLALWYDDGRVSARVALQGAAGWFNCISPCTQNPAQLKNYPAQGVTTQTPVYNPGSPNFKSATRYIDAKIGYKWKPGVEFFIEGRNLANATTTTSQGPYAPLSNGVPNLLDYAYSGRRIMLGVQFRTL